jgi:hypothetical protein
MLGGTGWYECEVRSVQTPGFTERLWHSPRPAACTSESRADGLNAEYRGCPTGSCSRKASFLRVLLNRHRGHRPMREPQPEHLLRDTQTTLHLGAHDRACGPRYLLCHRSTGPPPTQRTTAPAGPFFFPSTNKHCHHPTPCRPVARTGLVWQALEWRRRMNCLKREK